jgi:pimeloyl-ACP methyl ester carboxylesterase
MTNWTSSHCKANGIDIYYTRTGGNKPPLILLHGLTTNGNCWTPLALALENKYDIIIPDARGHGKSSVTNYGYQYEDLANDVLGLIKALKLSDPILLGHSMGGLTSAVVASQNPKLLSGLILADPTFLSPEAQVEVFNSDAADQHRRALKTSFDELVAEARIKHPERSLDVLERNARAKLQTSIKAFDILKPPNPDYKDLISKIEVPTLLVIGDAGVVTFAAARELQRLNPGLQVEQIAGAGHGLQFDQPAGFEAVVKSFLHSI